MQTLRRRSASSSSSPGKKVQYLAAVLGLALWGMMLGQMTVNQGETSTATTSYTQNEEPVFGDEQEAITEQEVNEINYEHIVGRMDYWADTESIDSSKTLVMVSHREAYIGCRDYEDYLSPEFHTMFIFPEDYAREWKLHELVENATPEQTMGLHLFFVDERTAGEFLGRRTALAFIEEELKPRNMDIEFIFSCNCDQHVIPRDHDYHQSFGDLTLKFEQDFRRLKELRAEGQIVATNIQEDDERNGFEVLAMNPLLYEEFPSMENLDEHFHGKDLDWWHRNEGVDGKPQWLIDADIPWVYDVARFTESHALMFDVVKLLSIYDEYFVHGMDLHSYPSETHLIGKIANKNKLTILRNNEIYMHCDFVHHVEDLDVYPDYVDLDWMRLENLDLMARMRNPRKSFEVFHQFYEANGMMTGLIWGAGVIGAQYSDAWLPASVPYSLVQSHDASYFLKSLFSLLGYELVHPVEDGDTELEFQLDGAYPSAILLKVWEGEVDDEVNWHEFLHIVTEDGELLRYSSCAECSVEDIRATLYDDRFINVPLTGNITMIKNSIRLDSEIVHGHATHEHYFQDPVFNDDF